MNQYDVLIDSFFTQLQEEYITQQPAIILKNYLKSKLFEKELTLSLQKYYIFYIKLLLFPVMQHQYIQLKQEYSTIYSNLEQCLTSLNNFQGKYVKFMILQQRCQQIHENTIRGLVLYQTNQRLILIKETAIQQKQIINLLKQLQTYIENENITNFFETYKYCKTIKSSKGQFQKYFNECLDYCKDQALKKFFNKDLLSIQKYRELLPDDSLIEFFELHLQRAFIFTIDYNKERNDFINIIIKTIYVLSQSKNQMDLKSLSVETTRCINELVSSSMAKGIQEQQNSLLISMYIQQFIDISQSIHTLSTHMQNTCVEDYKKSKSLRRQLLENEIKNKTSLDIQNTTRLQLRKIGCFDFRKISNNIEYKQYSVFVDALKNTIVNPFSSPVLENPISDYQYYVLSQLLSSIQVYLECSFMKQVVINQIDNQLHHIITSFEYVVFYNTDGPPKQLQQNEQLEQHFVNVIDIILPKDKKETKLQFLNNVFESRQIQKAPIFQFEKEFCDLQFGCMISFINYSIVLQQLFQKLDQWLIDINEKELQSMIHVFALYIPQMQTVFCHYEVDKLINFQYIDKQFLDNILGKNLDFNQFQENMNKFIAVLHSVLQMCTELQSNAAKQVINKYFEIKLQQQVDKYIFQFRKAQLQVWEQVLQFLKQMNKQYETKIIIVKFESFLSLYTSKNFNELERTVKLCTQCSTNEMITQFLNEQWCQINQSEKQQNMQLLGYK